MADLQKNFTKFHATIKVDTEELREKREILVDKIKESLRKQGHPQPEVVNQGSYIYGVGIVPTGGAEYDIDVGLAFDILSKDYDATTVRKWVFDAIKDHTDKVVQKGPCIRVHYAAGYHVDLVCYAKHKDSAEIESFQLARKDNTWSAVDPKKLKEIVFAAREPFKNTKDSSGSDQFQRIVRALKRWNDLAIPGESDDKPFGLAILLLVRQALTGPKLNKDNHPDDLAALLAATAYASAIPGRISINKPTPEWEDVFAKLGDAAMTALKTRLSALAAALREAQTDSDSDAEKAAKLVAKHLGSDLPTEIQNSNSMGSGAGRAAAAAAISTVATQIARPPKPWCE